MSTGAQKPPLNNWRTIGRPPALAWKGEATGPLRGTRADTANTATEGANGTPAGGEAPASPLTTVTTTGPTAVCGSWYGTWGCGGVGGTQEAMFGGQAARLETSGPPVLGGLAIESQAASADNLMRVPSFDALDGCSVLTAVPC